MAVSKLSYPQNESKNRGVAVFLGGPNLRIIRVMISTPHHNTCGVCGVDSEEIASNGGVSWVFVNFISVFICSRTR